MITLNMPKKDRELKNFQKPATGGFLLGKRMVHRSHKAYNRQASRQSLRKGDW